MKTTSGGLDHWGQLWPGSRKAHTWRDFDTEPRETASQVPDERMAATERVGAGKSPEAAHRP